MNVLLQTEYDARRLHQEEFMRTVKTIGLLLGVLGIFAGLSLVSGCTFTPDPIIYEVGDTGPAGGLIFYDKGSLTDGWQYLEAAPYGWYNSGDDPLLPWGGSGTSVGNTSTLLETGEANTALIVTALGAGTYAAKVCDDYSVVVDGMTYDDWFLPSREELSRMYTELNSIGGFTAYHYWSSSELSATDARSWSFLNNNTSLYDKTNNFRCRPARAF